MSLISLRIGPRYRGLVDYFKRNPLGTCPPDMTELSLLPPVDRCLILEQLIKCQIGNRVDLIDKLSMAYLKAGWRDIANEFLSACSRMKWLDDEELVFFKEKISDLLIHDVSLDYSETLSKLPQYSSGDELGMLIKELCEKYSGHEVLAGMHEKGDVGIVALAQFKEERRKFLFLLQGTENGIESH